MIYIFGLIVVQMASWLYAFLSYDLEEVKGEPIFWEKGAYILMVMPIGWVLLIAAALFYVVYFLFHGVLYVLGIVKSSPEEWL